MRLAAIRKSMIAFIFVTPTKARSQKMERIRNDLLEQISRVSWKYGNNEATSTIWKTASNLLEKDLSLLL
jgi:hypothetical protein